MHLTLSPPAGETIVGAAAGLRDRRTSCAGLLESCLERIDAAEPNVRAWVFVDREGARAQAARLDAELAEGSPRGPLHGIPIGVKDIIDVAGLPTAAGFGPWTGRIAEHDAPIVSRLRAAGAIIVGKTVTTTFAWIDPPVTRNPWNLDRTPGGSSSGSAAALACAMVLGALGSQTGGSITRPASFCGVAGLKPTHGRLPDAGVVPLAPSLDHPGLMARTVADLATLWPVVAESDPRDLKPTDRPLLRLGRLRGLFQERAEPSMRAALDQTLDALAHAGFSVVDVELPADFDAVIPHHRRIMAAEAAESHRSRFATLADAYPPRIRSLVEEGLQVDPAILAVSRAHQAHMRTSVLECFRNVDVLATPAAIGPAPDPSTTGDPVFNSPWSYTGFPTVSFPIGLAPDSLPLAVQLVGLPFGEADLLHVARRCESVIALDRGTAF